MTQIASRMTEDVLFELFLMKSNWFKLVQIGSIMIQLCGYSAN